MSSESSAKLQLHLAPMHRYTHLEALEVFRLMSPKVVLHHEMVTAPAFLRHPEKWRSHVKGEVSFQIAGRDPESLAASARWIKKLGYTALNWNLGCPSPALQALGAGALLYCHPQAAVEGFQALRESTELPLSIKCRLGVDAQDTKATFFKWIERLLYEADCRHFIVHARKAWLKGMNPKENRLLPPLHHAWVIEAARIFPEAEWTLNGGMNHWDQPHLLNQGLSGIMLGRAILQTPSLLLSWEKGTSKEEDGDDLDRQSFLSRLEERLKPLWADLSPRQRSRWLQPLSHLFQNLQNKTLKRAWRAKLAEAQQSPLLSLQILAR